MRRLVLCAARRDPGAFTASIATSARSCAPAQRVSRRLVIRLASAGHRATDRAGEGDLAVLPARLDRIDAWIAQGLLDGAELNAADFQIAPNIALLLRFEDLAPFVEGRPAARLAQRVAPDFPGAIDRRSCRRAWLRRSRRPQPAGRAGPAGPDRDAAIDRRSHQAGVAPGRCGPALVAP